MPANDNDLLARLNALKPTSVSLASNTPTVDVETSPQQSLEDRLASRLKNLRNGQEQPSASPEPASSSPAAQLIAQTRDEVAADSSDPIRDWQTSNEDDEQSLEDLLAELGPDSQWQMDPEDPKNINALLKEAKEALPAENDQEDDTSSMCAQQGDDEEAEKEDQQDEQEADDYVRRLMAALEVDKKYGKNDDEENTLPTTPIQPVSEAIKSINRAIIDKDLESRFSQLGMGGGLELPSTPTNKPSSVSNSATKPRGGPQQFSNEEIDSWCCICNEDGEVKCFGCDGDLYCAVCWSAGHGHGPGRERGHKAVFITKGDDKKKKVAA